MEEKEFKNYFDQFHDQKKNLKIYKSFNSEENNYRKGFNSFACKNFNKKPKILYENIVHKRSINYPNTDVSDPDKVIGKIAKYEIKINKPIKLSLIK